MKTIAMAFVLGLAGAGLVLGQTATITADDLKMIEGAKWIGTLTYLDYRSNKTTSIKSNLIVRRSPEHGGLWWFDYEYPDEPKANSSSSSALVNEGKIFFDQNVVERTTLADKSLRIVTTRAGEDNNKKALFRYTYLLGTNKFSLKKEVQALGSDEWFERNIYTWTR